MKKKKNPKRVMQIERYLSDTRFIVAIIVGIDIFFFMILNYVVNSLIAIPDMIKDLDNPGKYIGLFNVLPNITNFKEYGGIFPADNHSNCFFSIFGYLYSVQNENGVVRRIF